jgi:hypothetical protein
VLFVKEKEKDEKGMKRSGKERENKGYCSHTK